MRPRAWTRVLPSAFLLLAVAARLLPWKHVFASGNVYFYDADGYMRFRRVLVYLNAFPATAVHDYFQGFPRGTGVLSPPTMEYALAALAWPFRSWPSLMPALEHLVALLPPLCGGVTVVVLYLFVRRWFGLLAGCCAALVMALAPQHIDVTVVGRFDNEMLEPLLLLGVCALYSRTYEAPGERSWWIATGFASVLYLLVWRGALFPLGIVVIDLATRIFLARGSDESRSLCRSAATMYSVPAVAMLVICASDMWGTRDVLRYNVPSLFHLALFGGAVLFCRGAGLILPLRGRRHGYGLAALTVWIALAVAACALLWEQIGGGLAVIGGGDPWLDSIAQYQRSSLRDAPFQYGMAVVLVPVVLVLLSGPGYSRVAPRRLIVVWTLVMLAAAWLRLRFSMYFALNVAMLAGVGASYATAVLGHRRVGARSLVGTAALSAVVLLQAPTFPYLLAIFRYGPTFSIKGDIENTLLWLRDETPSAGDPLRPSVPPDYGVLAPWDWGGWIETIAGRPSIATSFGTETHGMEELSRFLLAEDEATASAVLMSNRVRYVVLQSVFRTLSTHAELLGVQGRYFQEQWDARQEKRIYTPTEDAFSLVSVRLFFADGSLAGTAPFDFEPVEGLRLVYEASTPEPLLGLAWEVKRIKVFEVVTGARVTVRGTPGRSVSLSQAIETNQGRRFVYRNEKVCGADGTATFAAVYAPRTGPGATGALGPVVLASQGRSAEVAVTEEDVRAGTQFSVDLDHGLANSSRGNRSRFHPALRYSSGSATKADGRASVSSVATSEPRYSSAASEPARPSQAATSHGIGSWLPTRISSMTTTWGKTRQKVT